jgi:hypothetical protein
MAKANQQFRSYTVKDPSRLDALIQADLTALDGWKIVHIEVQTQPLYTFAWVVYELV